MWVTRLPISYDYQYRQCDLHELTVEDLGVTLSNSPVTIDLAPGQANSTITGTYTLTQADIDSGNYANTADAKALTPDDEEVTDSDTEDIELPDDPSITLEKTGTIVDDVVLPAGMVNVGDQISYQFTVENTGNVTLTDVEVIDVDPDVVLTGCTIGTLAVGEVDITSCTGVYTVTQDDINAGTFTNNAEVWAEDPEGDSVTDSDDDTQDIPEGGLLGVAKTVSSPPVLISTGIWQFTYEIEIANMGNVALVNLQISDDLTAVFPIPHVFLSLLKSAVLILM